MSGTTIPGSAERGLGRVRELRGPGPGVPEVPGRGGQRPQDQPRQGVHQIEVTLEVALEVKVEKIEVEGI